jgi:hypothetical protein
MEFLNAWWGGLDPLSRWFFGVAIVFSIIFLWQLIMSFVGLAGGDGGVDSHVEAPDAHHAPSDADASVAAFKLLSVRSILAFFTLFFWSAALKLQEHAAVGPAMGIGLIWGVSAMVLVALLLYLMKRMAETGNLRYSSCVGCAGTVYLDIPANGMGEVRTLVNNVVTHLKARNAAAAALKAGTPVRIVKVIGPGAVEVSDQNVPAAGGEKAVAS